MTRNRINPLLFVAGIVTALSCTDKQPGALKTLASLQLEEVSGLQHLPDESLWALEDSGNSNKIYRLGDDGKITHTLTLIDAENTDWEDMASDAGGNLYIGDFGNNDNNRKNLVIYKLNAADLGGASAKVAQRTDFYYPEQTEFPPKKSHWMFDAEAFCLHNGYFYIFTKNRSKMFDGSFYVYRVPNLPGRHKAEQLGKLKSCSNYRKCAIAGADISPDGKTIALISGGRIWLVTGFTHSDFSDADVKETVLGSVTQKEGITFRDEGTLFIADEKEKKSGGKLYSFSLD